VRSSQYLRAQAQLYFDIARLLTDPRAAEQAMATSAKYLAQADEMEQTERISSERAVG
jgi:orotate phosphoribosyltransferase